MALDDSIHDAPDWLPARRGNEISVYSGSEVDEISNRESF
jgi:hypothetical protein